VVRKDKEGKPFEVGDPKATAVIGATLIVVGSDVSQPTVLPLAIPSYDKVGGTAKKPVATGYFSLDLLRVGRIANTAQTYFLYLFSGKHMVGPVLSALVDPDAV
jgi:hypothetical protein